MRIKSLVNNNVKRGTSIINKIINNSTLNKQYKFNSAITRAFNIKIYKLTQVKQ